MVGGSRTAPLGKQQPIPYAFTTPPSPINEQLLTSFFNELKQSMMGVWEGMKEMRGDIRDLNSQNVSHSASVTQLEDTSTLRIGSKVAISEPGSTAVDVMSATIDQPMDQTINPGPSCPNDTIELGCSSDDHLLAAGSDEETDATQEDDLSALMSECEEEKEPPETPLRWADE
jgi:hypothetical protein